MTPAEEYAEMLRECWPVLEETARRLGSWEAVGEQIGRDLAPKGETSEITKPAPGNT